MTSQSAPFTQPSQPVDDSTRPVIYQHALAYLIGMEGVALMKAFAGEFDRDFTLARLAEIRRLLDHAGTFGEGAAVSPMSATAAYDGWAATYDGPGNSIFAIEEAVVRPILERMPVGVAVDAACGTGRHAEYLASRGHQVHAFDGSPGMLAVARDKVPSARIAEADLTHLPIEDSCADLVVCAIALAHVEDLRPVFAEFARVLKPGGHLVVSDTRGHFIGSRLYPLVKEGLDGEIGYVPTWFHPTSEYLNAAIPAGFSVRACQEPRRPTPIVDEASSEADTPASEPGLPPDIWCLHPCTPDAANAAYRDHPALIVWHFQLG